MNRDNIYMLLGISQRAPVDAVKKAFKDFAKRNHPDFHPGDPAREDRFKRVTSAYQHWKLIQATVQEITRLKNASPYARYAASGFKPWSFSCRA